MRVDLVLDNWQLFASGVWMTLQLTFLALAIGFIVALPFGIARARRVPVFSPLINGYVYLFRGTPLLVQLSIFVPATLVLTLWLLPRAKGALLGLMWALRLRGDERQ